MHIAVVYRNYKPYKIKCSDENEQVEWLMDGSTAVLNRADASNKSISQSATEIEKLPFVQAVEHIL